MRYFFNTEGSRQLADTIGEHPLLAFDFDGTLAPIVPLPEDAKAPLSIISAMQRLCAIAPVAIITGRSIEDVRPRLGFEPAYLIGNHGAEGLPGNDPALQEAIIAGWLASLEAKRDSLPEGVQIEHKGASLSLHYRLARSRELAAAAIATVVTGLTPLPVLIGGKCVVNLLPPGAPDKHVALTHLLRLENRRSALFVGDDETDEAIFRKAPAHWLTIRVEYSTHSAARYFIGNQNEMALLIQLIEQHWRKRSEVES